MKRRVVALVTGCSEGGLGHAICKALASSGCIVYATARQENPMNLQQHGCIELELDVTSTDNINTVVQHVIKKSGRIDVVVNNAGIMLKGWAVECPLEDIKQQMEVNFFAVCAMNQAVAPYMIKQRSGVIVNIGSSTGYCAVPQAAAYSASKFAVRAYSDALRVELAPFNVKVMHVAPGFMQTQLFQQACNVQSKPESAYSQFKHANETLQSDDLEHGMGSWFPTDPQYMANNIVKYALRRNPPRHYVDGWMSWVIYCCGCYAPCWLVDLVQLVRLRLPPVFSF